MSKPAQYIYTSTIGKMQDIREKPVRGKVPRRVTLWKIPDVGEKEKTGYIYMTYTSSTRRDVEKE